MNGSTTGRATRASSSRTARCGPCAVGPERPSPAAGPRVRGGKGGGGPGPPQVRGRAGPFLNRGSGGSLETAGGTRWQLPACRVAIWVRQKAAPAGTALPWAPAGSGDLRRGGRGGRVPPAPCLRAPFFFCFSSPFFSVKKQTEPGPFAGSIVRRSGGCPRRCCHLTAPGSAPSGPRRSWGRA